MSDTSTQQISDSAGGLYKTLLFSVHDQVCTITINRPDKLNALSGEVLDELRHLVTDVRERADVRVAIITGAGAKAFVAGADIKELSALNDPDDGREFAQNGQAVFNLIETSPKPFIAAVNGFALGGGCELALACHIRVCGENAKFGQPELNLGTIPGYGGTQRLARIVGTTLAADMMLTARMLNAQEALASGLVSRIATPDELMNVANQMATAIVSKAPLAISAALECMIEGVDGSIEDGLNREARHFGMLSTTGDFHEGTTAFLEKRTANFKGE
jgi:enoyl-CoA hydratase